MVNADRCWLSRLRRGAQPAVACGLSFSLHNRSSSHCSSGRQRNPVPPTIFRHSDVFLRGGRAMKRTLHPVFVRMDADKSRDSKRTTAVGRRHLGVVLPVMFALAPSGQSAVCVHCRVLGDHQLQRLAATTAIAGPRSAWLTIITIISEISCCAMCSNVLVLNRSASSVRSAKS
jgi:hypothetical protein